MRPRLREIAALLGWFLLGAAVSSFFVSPLDRPLDWQWFTYSVPAMLIGSFRAGKGIENSFIVIVYGIIGGALIAEAFFCDYWNIFHLLREETTRSGMYVSIYSRILGCTAIVVALCTLAHAMGRKYYSKAKRRSPAGSTASISTR